MILDQKKYINNKNKLLPVLGLDEERFGELRGILSDHFSIRDMSSEDEVLDLLSDSFNRVIAVVFDAKLISKGGFDLLDRIDSDKRFVEIPVIAVSDTCDSDICRRCVEAGVGDYFEPPFNRYIIPKRIINTVRAKDSVTIHEIEVMLRELPSNIYLKDANANYIFSSHYWHHLKAQPQGWTIRGKTEFDIQKTRAVAEKAYAADQKMIADRKGTNYILEMNDDGIHEFIQVIKSPTYDSEGNVSGIIAIMNDVTELETLKRSLENKTEQIAAELNVASQIQYSMLPMDLEENERFEIKASMTPAKDVGGDFYDYFFIDDDHLALTMADVSGKGVPAALCMTISKIVIHDIALEGRTPAGILSEANKRIFGNNKMGLFVTVWFGVLDLRTGVITCANAGHEYPAIRREGGNYEIQHVDNYPPIGADADTEYADETITLNKGDSIFLYTDGVTDAKAPAGGHFGEARMLAALNEDPGALPEAVIARLKERIDDFGNKESPFDDITMMSVRYKG